MSKDLNKATARDLERTFEIDGERAQDLVRKRDELGGFESWDQVEQVPGFSGGMVQNLQEAGFTLGGGRQARSGGGTKQGGRKRGGKQEHSRGGSSGQGQPAGEGGGASEYSGSLLSRCESKGQGRRATTRSGGSRSSGSSRSSSGSARSSRSSGTSGDAQSPQAGNQGDGKVNLNQAGAEELTQIPGIGEGRARQLLEWRDQHGPFKNWEDVDQVPGIAEANLHHLQNHATL